MKNIQICPKCNTENSFYAQSCVKCGNILRGRVVNIDLWKTVWNIIESPKHAFSQIIFSEHKNFLSLILFLAGVKFFVNAYTVKNAISGGESSFFIFIDFIIGIAGYVFFILIVSAINNFLMKSLKIKTRFKDFTAVYTYSFFPMIVGLLIFFPLEYALFGQYFFTYDPSPFFLKTTAAYVLLSFEGLLYLWTLILLVIATNVLTRKILFSIVTGILIILLFGIFQIFIPFI